MSRALRRPTAPPPSVSQRVVLDTNAVLSALVFGGGTAARLRQAWQGGHCLPLASTATVQELIRVLAHPKFRLSADEQRELLADYLPWAASVRIPQPPPAIPACRDPLDAPFLHLAVAGKADALVSGDKGLLALAGQTLRDPRALRFSRHVARRLTHRSIAGKQWNATRPDVIPGRSRRTCCCARPWRRRSQQVLHCVQDGRPVQDDWQQEVQFTGSPRGAATVTQSTARLGRHHPVTAPGFPHPTLS